ncbi:MAG: family 43 glycosylhydrolase [Sphingopyxis sp.]
MEWPDTTILKDGDDYYMTHSSFDASPGLLSWHPRDLVNWLPIVNALPAPLGTVFACDLVKHDGRYIIYIPFMRAPWSTGLADFANIYAIYADDIRGPWSAPVNLHIGGLIDPGHAVGADGQRYLFLSGVSRVRLSADGLSTAGPVETVYDGWRYPDDWITEAYALEGPKICRRGDWFYLVSAVGGTAGPPTGHMVIVARAPTLDGPWVNAPNNPIVRTRSADEAWHSRGHATLIEGPGGQWYMVYHGYENGYHSLGRQTLLEPVRWTDDGWPVAMGGDLARPLPMPAAPAGPRRTLGSGAGTPAHGIALSDDFSALALGFRWRFFGQPPGDGGRATIADGALTLRARGTGPADSCPLTQIAGDRAYECQVDMELDGTAEGGLLLFYNDRMFLGLGCNGQRMITYRGGRPSFWPEPAPAVRRISLKIINDRQIVSFYYRTGDGPWVRHGLRSEVSGYHAGTMDDLQGLRPALFAAGNGQVRFRNYQYRALA